MPRFFSFFGKLLAKCSLVNKYIGILSQAYGIRAVFGVYHICKAVSGTRMSDNICGFYDSSVIEFNIFTRFQILILPIFANALFLSLFSINFSGTIFFLQAVTNAKFSVIERTCIYIIIISIYNPFFFEILTQLYIIDLIVQVYISKVKIPLNKLLQAPRTNKFYRTFPAL